MQNIIANPALGSTHLSTIQAGEGPAQVDLQYLQNFSIENQSVAPMTCLDLVTSDWLPVSCPRNELLKDFFGIAICVTFTLLAAHPVIVQPEANKLKTN
jgi:hypothetical protein